MVKRCAVEKCHTGEVAERRKRSVLKKRQLSIFCIPKRLNAVQSWSLALGQQLRQEDTICELHFHDEDVNKVDVQVLPDGTVRNVPRQAYTLRQGAIPIAQIQDSAMEVDHIADNVETSIAVVAMEEGLNNDQVIGTRQSLVPSGSSTAAEEPPATINCDEHVDVDAQNELTIQRLIDHVGRARQLPEPWSCHQNPREAASILFVHIDLETVMCDLYLVVHNDLSVTIHTSSGQATGVESVTIESLEDIEKVLTMAAALTLCNGTGLANGSRSPCCTGVVAPQEYTYRIRKFRKIERRRLDNANSTAAARAANWKHASRLYKRRCVRLNNKTRQLNERISEMRRDCAAANRNALQEKIATLPEIQQQAVKACFNAANKVKSSQRRYENEWLYECLLMRNKNRKLYEHMRSRNILALPSSDTLNRMIRRIKPCYGFQKPVFDAMRLKASGMAPADRRGGIVVDEMALSPLVSFDRSTRKFVGFVDLGQHTPSTHASTQGDHALVFMFQPYRGKWVQVLGAFLTKHAAVSAILSKLIVECIIRTERTGFHVDSVTTDGAQTNRGVWKILGITAEEPKCVHPYDSERPLYVLSDFPHLVKCFRNGFLNEESIQTPVGIVQKQHFADLLPLEGYATPRLKVAHKLTPSHINPQGYQKMRVPLAFELFSDPVRVAMELFRDDPQFQSFDNAGPTIRFIKIMRNLIEAMMSRIPRDALHPQDTCVHKKAIEDFLQFMGDWERTAKAENLNFGVTSSTCTGFKVTLRGTLGLTQYLCEVHGYEYLMTARVNQDVLERFFGMMRHSCGSNDHPDPMAFALSYRLLSTYSLMKPPKGSNVSGVELLESIMERNESAMEIGTTTAAFDEKLDALLESGRSEDTSEDPIMVQDDRDVRPSTSQHLQTHDYSVTHTLPVVIAYVAGFLVKKISKKTKCNLCIEMLKATERTERDRMIEKMERFDNLIYPSAQLYELCKWMEECTLEVVGTMATSENSVLDVLDKMATKGCITFVGYADHEKELTRKAIERYLMMRMNFLTRYINTNSEEKRNKQRKHRKNARL